MDRIGSGNIDNLEIHLERSIALVPSYLYPHLTGRYESFMPGKPSVLHEKVQAKMLAYAMVCLSKLITSHSLLRGGQPLQPALKYTCI